jgi:phosphate transport system substrate-binding protein
MARVPTFSLLIAVAVILSGCGRGPSSQLQIRGSDTLLQVSQIWAQTFIEQNPEALVVVTGGGSGTGIKALINGTAHVANSSRDISSKEEKAAVDRGIEMHEFEVARDAMSIILNPANPIRTLTTAQVRELYTGKVTNWNQLGGPDARVILAARDTSSGTYEYFKDHVLEGDNYVPGTLHLASNPAIVAQVSQDRGAVGYVGLGYLSPDIKPVPIQQDAASPPVEPTVDNVLDGSYPISRALFQYTAGAPQGQVKQWIDFVLSEEGQKIVRQHGFIPVR